MRIPTYLSPSAIAKWETSVEGFYLHYLTDNPPPREQQNQAMAIGSSFDAYVKAFLHEKLFGKSHTDSNRFGLRALLEAQVEPQHRDWAKRHGLYAFQVYQSSGALLDLLSDLQAAQKEPRFEFEVKGQVDGYREGVMKEMEGVIFLGKPDAAYINRDGKHIILDWKVNGYCSNYATSPKPGYVRLRGMGGRSWGMHKGCSPMEIGGITVNIASTLEHCDEGWARQLAIYGWLCDEPVGSDFIVAIDQLSCKPSGMADIPPEIRVAEHRIRIGKEYQFKVFNRAKEIWSIIKSGHIFRQMSEGDSKARCQLLDQQAEELYGPNADSDFLEMTRR